jgi:uncharacterized protein (TIGR02391 family)
MIDLDSVLKLYPDFYNTTQKKQIMYLAFAYVKDVGINAFSMADIRNIFTDLDLVVPSNIQRELTKLATGRPPVLIKKKDQYVFHPLAYKIMSDEYQEYPKNSEKKSTNISVFSMYDFHPQIRKVAFDQFADGHYKESIQNALVEVIDQVKNKAGNPIYPNGKDMDGDDLMNKVFGCDGKHEPVLKFNELETSLDKDEQRGIMNLFKGVVGIRNKKAHLNFIQNDPLKTIEYLSLASLLLRLLEEASESS